MERLGHGLSCGFINRLPGFDSFASQIDNAQL